MIYQKDCSLSIKGHVALGRNTGLGYFILLLRLIPGDLYSACPLKKFYTIPSLLECEATLSPYHNAFELSREAVCIIHMVVFAMTRLGREPTIYHMRGVHAKH